MLTSSWELLLEVSSNESVEIVFHCMCHAIMRGTSACIPRPHHSGHEEHNLTMMGRVTGIYLLLLISPLCTGIGASAVYPIGEHCAEKVHDY